MCCLFEWCFVGCWLLRIVFEEGLELLAWFWFWVVMWWVLEVEVGSDLFAAGWWCLVCGGSRSSVFASILVGVLRYLTRGIIAEASY